MGNRTETHHRAGTYGFYYGDEIEVTVNAVIANGGKIVQPVSVFGSEKVPCLATRQEIFLVSIKAAGEATILNNPDSSKRQAQRQPLDTFHYTG